VLESFLAATPPLDGARESFCHNDLGAEHILVDDAGRIAGVIDWTDAATTDPAYDWGLVLRDLGPAVVAEALTQYGLPFDDGDHARAVFYARCALIEDLAYGIRDGRTAYLHAARRNLAHTFGGVDQ
jgi:aminoglycoside phosphotransferase (APT) family kinase protein